MVVTLRPATSADQEFFRELYASTRADLAAVPWDDATRAAVLSQQFAARDAHYRQQYPGARVDVVTVDDDPAGRIYVWCAEGELHLVDVALLPPFRGRGIGSGLLAELLAEADRDGRSVSLHVEETNPARHLYARLGFVPVAERPPYVAMQRAAVS